MIHIAVCDDELICLEETKQSIHKWASDRDTEITVFTFDNGDSLLAHCKAERTNVVFLDIMMPLFNGMELAHEIRKNDSAIKIVFLTSSPEFAVESYDVKASGYLLKPFSFEKLCTVLDDCTSLPKAEPDHIIVKTAAGYQKLYLHSVEYIEAQNKKVVFRTTDGTAIETLNTISGFAETLTLEMGFFKCHRSYIAYIPNVNHFDTSKIITKSGFRIPISRGYSKSFKHAYFAYMFRKGGVE